MKKEILKSVYSFNLFNKVESISIYNVKHSIADVKNEIINFFNFVDFRNSIEVDDITNLKLVKVVLEKHDADLIKLF